MAARKSSGWLKWIVILAVLGGGGGVWWKYYRKSGVTPPKLKTVTLSKGDVVQQVTANGSLNPVRQIDVGSQISGTLLDIKVDFNSKVKEGELLAQIDPATYERALVQAEAELANSAAGLELAQVNFDRARELFSAKLISKSEFDQAKANFSQAQANVKTRQANVDRAKVDLGRCTIFSPIDGMVISRRIEIGQTVAASLNAPTLFVIANDLAKMRIEAAVSEADVGNVVEGQTVNFTVEAFPNAKFKGVVDQVRFAPTTNQNVVTYTTIVAVDNKDLKLRPGMTATASIITAEKKGVLRIPNSAVRFKPPAGIEVQGGTNAPAGAKPTDGKAQAKVELATSGPFAGLPIPPWQAGGTRRRPTDEERTAYEATLTPEQKEKYQQVMNEMRARFAQGGGPGGGGGDRPRRTEPEGPRSQTVYLVENSAAGDQPTLKPVTVRLGITDGTNTEIIEGLKEGDILASGTVTQGAAPSSPQGSSPFGGPFGGRPAGR
jgi:HlyD family secretion protein